MFTPKDYDLSKAYRREQEQHAEHIRLEDEVKENFSILKHIMQAFKRLRMKPINAEGVPEQPKPAPQWKKERATG